MKLSVNSALFTRFYDQTPEGFEKVFAGFEAFGFPLVDLNIASLPGFTSAGMQITDKAKWREDILRVGAAAKAHGVGFEQCHYPFFEFLLASTPYLEEKIAMLDYAVEAAALLKIPYAVMHPSYGGQADKAADFKGNAAFLKRYIEHSAQRGVTVCLENMRRNNPYRFCTTAEELCELTDHFSGMARICWDFGHAHISQLDQQNALRLVGKRLAVTHVDDNFSGDDLHVLPFEGTICWEKILPVLGKIGYAGNFNFELSPKVPQNLLAPYSAYVHQLADYLMARTGCTK